MSLARAFARNVFFKGSGELVIRLLSFLFVVLVARRLGGDDFGVFNFGYSFPLLFVVLVDFGFNPLLVRDAARQPSETAAIFGNLLAMKISLSVVFFAAMYLSALWLAPTPAMRQAALIFALFVVLNSFTEFCSAVFHARQEMQFEAVVMTTQKLLLLTLGVAALHLGFGVMGVAGAYAAAGGGGLLLSGALLWKRRLVAFPWRLDGRFVRYAVRQALPLTLTTLFINLYFRIDMTLLARLRPASEVGWYGAAHKCIEVLMVVPAVLVVAAFPGFAKLQHEDPARLAHAGRRLLRVLLVLGIPLAAGSFAVGGDLLGMVFGMEFIPAGQALAWLSVALCFIFVNYALSYLLITAGQQKVNALVSGLAVLVSVGANLLLIPAWGYVGAAVAGAITEAFLFVAYAAAVQRKMFAVQVWGPIGRIGLATAVMLLPVWALRPAHPLLAIAAGLAVYIPAIWLAGAVTRQDADWLRRVIQKGRHA